ncbi:MAG TPA: acetate--CoA ligase family protein [Vicinamibacterales bacterium]|nr:acetate--CoA ligase family protein [Vicinamibacterales bacterium]
MTGLNVLFRPRAVAVVGASRDRRSVGGAILHNLLFFEFQGQVFPVNPKASVVHSLKCYPTVEAIPDPVDLAVIAVPKALVLEAVESCGRKGIGAVVVITAGFKETGEAGLALEREVVSVVKRHGMRLVGPNCMGIINMDPAVRLQASFSANEPVSGSVAFSSQSGALGEAILALLRERGLGLSMFVSLGNKADVSGNDLLEYWEEDPNTHVILMYLESFGNPQRFLEIGQRVSKKKPIIAVKSGRTAAGARAAASHTGSLAGADNAVDSLFAQAGVVRATSIEELFVFAAAFASQPIPTGTRVGIVTNSGGPAILATDACIELGLQIPTLSEATQRRIRAAVAPEASVANPVDMIATAAAPQYEAAMRAVSEDPGIDAIIAIFTSLEMIDGPAVAQGIIRGAAGCRKPVVVCFMGNVRSREAVDLMRQASLAVYTFPEDAARALAAMARYAQWLARPVGHRRVFEDIDRGAIDAVIQRARAEQRAQLTLAEAQCVLGHAGIPVLPWREVRSRDEALAAASELGLPLVAKVSSALVVHKSEMGGVRVGLATPAAVAAAFDEMTRDAIARDPQATLVLQQQASTGTEVIAGATRDPKFGPLLMFGLGGIFVEVMKDVAFRVHPLSDADAHEMIRAVKGFPLLEGARGRPRADLAALETILLRLDSLMAACPAIVELDLNPVFAAPPGAVTAAADARITIQFTEPVHS